ncbi:hypothetical protein CONCODRAFT_1983 [Conidiobolus coronatus NRRL 28638]|uniref:Intracellular septation protein A n=1 Tax=Conidiobolus coronatus (strain ATCC 28846 / CBS 209.66 / NRRL 28638) TaxID=796925 RepID=A0A137PIW4_CONC2|nr:hypothetical protein CONCODRAFT_1983 [Conidiobolus coronatus NRRL 28638]|eukprot:KXN74910.1 hypothetical protein CONCODRAFT_1983 [Conidiobolus coronatus NRRL 28638]
MTYTQISKNNHMSSTYLTNSTNSFQQEEPPKSFLEKRFSKKTAKQLQYAGFFFQHAILEIILPLVLYFTLKGPLGELKATIISSVPTLLSAVYTIGIKRRFEPLPFIVIISFCIGLGLSLGFNNAKLNEIKVAIIIGAIGLAYLISLAFKRPLMYYFNRPWMTGNDPQKMKEYEAQWEKPEFARQMRVITVIWGTGFLLQAIANLVLIFTVSLDLIIVLGKALTYGNIAILAVITIIYSIWYEKRQKKPNLNNHELQA